MPEHRARQAVDLHDEQPPPGALRPRAAAKAPDGAIERTLHSEDPVIR
jgi:hypothetical protein